MCRAVGLLGACIATCLLLQLASADAQSPTGAKTLNLGTQSGTAIYNNERLGTSLDNILTSTSDSSLYDPLTVGQLRMLMEDAQPSWDPSGYDPDKTRRLGEKALAMQLGQSISRQIKESELRDTYNSLMRLYKQIKQSFRYSVQTDGDSFEVSRKKKGRKLLELNVDFNLKHGMDPQLRVGENFRFRYDYLYDRTMLEYGLKF